MARRKKREKQHVAINEETLQKIARALEASTEAHSRIRTHADFLEYLKVAREYVQLCIAAGVRPYCETGPVNEEVFERLRKVYEGRPMD